jgi:hypothetical protein
MVKSDDDYPTVSQVTDAPVYRSICGDVWYQIDGASGANLEKLDWSRRAYRWFYEGLHTSDFPVLVTRPNLRAAAVVVLCVLGMALSITGVVLGWRRLPHCAARDPLTIAPTTCRRAARCPGDPRLVSHTLEISHIRCALRKSQGATPGFS